METFFNLTGIAVLLAALAALANLAGWTLTEGRKPLFPFRPFNCRPCLTLWLTLALTLAAAAVVAPTVPVEGVAYWYGFAGIGVLLGLCNYFYVKSKYHTYD